MFLFDHPVNKSTLDGTWPHHLGRSMDPGLAPGRNRPWVTGVRPRGGHTARILQPYDEDDADDDDNDEDDDDDNDNYDDDANFFYY